MGSDKPKHQKISGDSKAAGDPLTALSAACSAHDAPGDASRAAPVEVGQGPRAASSIGAKHRAKASSIDDDVRATSAATGVRKHGARRGFPVFGLAVGFIAGVLAYAVTGLTIDPVYRPVVGQGVLVFISVAAAALLFIASPERWLRGAVHALGVGALIAIPTAFMLSAQIDAKNLSMFPPVFWFLVGAPVAGHLLIALSRASLAPAGSRYTELFSSGLTLPMIAAGSIVFALLGIVLLYSFAALTRSINVNLFHQVFQQPWFMLPSLGAICGLSIGLLKSLEPVLVSLRFVTLVLMRIAMPLTAVFSLALVAALALKGPEALFASGYGGPALLGLALVGMLIFNGVYQNGEGGPPPAWLRLSTITSLLVFPVFAGLAAGLFAGRIGEFGLTPARLTGLILSGLTALYSVVGLAGIASEVRRNTSRWMPIVAPLNAGMAAVWALTLILMATPIVNAWTLSARQQETLVLSGRANVDTFDYGYLRFALGAAGSGALARLAETRDHPKAEAIRAGAARALAAPSYALYRNPPPPPPAVQPADAALPPPPERSGVDALDFNPKDSNEPID